MGPKLKEVRLKASAKQAIDFMINFQSDQNGIIEQDKNGQTIILEILHFEMFAF